MLVLLFTDVESSTRLWEQHPTEMRAALARHDLILHTAIEERQGSVVKSTGDGLLATFESVVECVEACLDMQRSLRAAPWELGEPLRVRMGVHVGEAERRAGDLYGTAVNRAARIMSVGHGGQVLLSARAADVVADALPPDVGLRDLGAHRLKDLTQPEHLYQIVHPDLDHDFPPLATIDAHPNNLPIQVSEFFGREAELAAVRALLEERAARLVTLTGPGGTGKTRLGLQVAAELIDRYRDGVFFVDLSVERDADAAFEAILRELALSSARQGSPLQVLKGRLRDRAMLLVLDNFEQVTEAAVGIVELLEHCRDLVMLVTSRQALRLRGERVYHVPTMALPDARAAVSEIARTESVRLFVDRARSARPDFTLDGTNAAAVAEITVRLDGLPLAIELAAARLRLFSPRDLLDRLERRADALGSGARDLPARQRTLRSTIEWSYELLDRDECRLFELVSVFSTARLESVEEVCAGVHGDIDVIEVLASLIDKSLVRSVDAGGSQRFSMLRTVRDYAAERLAASPERAGAARRAHAEHYSRFALDVGGALEGRDREAALEDLSSELANLRSAWRYWVEAADRERLDPLVEALWTLFEARGWYHAAVDLARDLLGLLTTADPTPERDREEAALRARLARALMAIEGYTVDVEAEFHRVLDLAASAEHGTLPFPVLRGLAAYLMNVLDWTNGAAVGRQLLDLAEAENDDALRVEGHLVFGLTTAFAGDVVLGLEHMDRAIELFEPGMHRGRYRLGPSSGVVARIASGLMLRGRGFPDEASRRIGDGLALAARLDHPYSLAYALYHAGLHDLMRQRHEQVRPRAAELAAIADEHGYLVWQALASVLDGVALCALGRPDEGIEAAEAGSALYQGLTTPPIFWPSLLALRSSSFVVAGRLHRALELIDEAIAAAGSNEAELPEFRTLRGNIIAALPDADVAEAEASYRSAIRGTQITGERLGQLAARTALDRLLAAQGRAEPDRDGLRALYATFTEGFDEPELVAARAVLGLDR